MKSKYPKIILKPGREASLLRGHPWIFSGALSSVEGKPKAGDIVTATTHTGVPVALGFFNPKTDIAFRLLTNDVSAQIDKDFWIGRFRAASDLRKKIITRNTTAFRMINAEGDGMPGLIVDKYGDFHVFSISTAGMEMQRYLIQDILLNEFKSVGIYEQSDGKAREIEGLQERIGVMYGIIPDSFEIEENGLCFRVDVKAGQKTGFFLDQRPNRELARFISKKADVVLNCFSYTGAFSVYCASGGAKRVISVETSESANEIAGWNLEKNGFSLYDYPVKKADVFSFLRETDEYFDLIILDPPAFAKSKKDIVKAARGYKEINMQAIRRLRNEGFLLTFSCSNYIDDVLFQKIIISAVRDTGKNARLLQPLGPGHDHPTNLSHFEGRYLKGFFLCISR